MGKLNKRLFRYTRIWYILLIGQVWQLLSPIESYWCRWVMEYGGSPRHFYKYRGVQIWDTTHFKIFPIWSAFTKNRTIIIKYGQCQLRCLCNPSLCQVLERAYPFSSFHDSYWQRHTCRLSKKTKKTESERLCGLKAQTTLMVCDICTFAILYSVSCSHVRWSAVLSISTDGQRKASATSHREVGYFFPYYYYYSRGC